MWINQAFLNKEEELYFFESLYKETKWEQRTIKMFGKIMIQPRLIAWYGDEGISYTYSGNTFEATEWSKGISELKDKVEDYTDCQFNSALVNLYEHGQHSMSWHSDNEKELGRNPIIASVSLGANRKFQFKHIENKTLYNTVLEGGSLLLMEKETQHFWKHSLPKQKQVFEPRINITFRNVLC